MSIFKTQLPYYFNYSRCRSFRSFVKISASIAGNPLTKHYSAIADESQLYATSPFISVEFNSIRAITICQYAEWKAKLRRESHRCVAMFINLHAQDSELPGRSTSLSTICERYVEICLQILDSFCNIAFRIYQTSEDTFTVGYYENSNWI